jgi:hypothetical protein
VRRIARASLRRWRMKGYLLEDEGQIGSGEVHVGGDCNGWDQWRCRWVGQGRRAPVAELHRFEVAARWDQISTLHWSRFGD